MQENLKKFQVICIDPPYAFSDALNMSDVPRGAEANYKTMSIKDIIDLPVKNIADPNGCVLVIWVPSSLLKEGIQIMESWGFSLKQNYIWVKSKKSPIEDIVSLASKILSKKGLDTFQDFCDARDRALDLFREFSLNNVLGFGMGRLFRNTHEIALVGINSTKIYKQLQNKSQRTVSIEPNERHSKKPENLQNSLDLMFPDANKMEIFARRVRPGWTCLGNEVCGGEDIRDSLKKLF
jgi:N6-adenosine-specific RNA methylase IME4